MHAIGSFHHLDRGGRWAHDVGYLGSTKVTVASCLQTGKKYTMSILPWSVLSWHGWRNTCVHTRHYQSLDTASQVSQLSYNNSDHIPDCSRHSTHNRCRLHGTIIAAQSTNNYCRSHWSQSIKHTVHRHSTVHFRAVHTKQTSVLVFGSIKVL